MYHPNESDHNSKFYNNADLKHFKSDSSLENSFCKNIQLSDTQIFGQNCESDCPKKSDPFSPVCLIPLPVRVGSMFYDSPYFRRRNDRERERVRCVNDGYLQLKDHLPITNKEKRLSKVETLRCAINYIKYLQDLLSGSDENKKSNGGADGIQTMTDDQHCQRNQCVSSNQCEKTVLGYDFNNIVNPSGSYAEFHDATDEDGDGNLLCYSSDFTDGSSDGQ